METTLVYWGYIGNNGKENGKYYSILGSYWEYSVLRLRVPTANSQLINVDP